MKLYRTHRGIVIREAGAFYHIQESDWDQFVSRQDVLQYLRQLVAAGQLPTSGEPTALLPPIEGQEVWAAGVTYLRSREARMDESKSAGGGDFYDRVYTAERPELFFKATARTVVGHGGKVRIRGDSRWNVPEPELTLLIASTGAITGYTIGNDMSSRDIEGENPLYLPQAKVYNGSCALGPCVLLSDRPLDGETKIQMRIRRNGSEAFAGETTISRIKRPLSSLAQYLFRDNSFPAGCFLMTGTGIVPPTSFTLRCGDEITIAIEPIGTLVNIVE